MANPIDRWAAAIFLVLALSAYSRNVLQGVDGGIRLPDAFDGCVVRMWTTATLLQDHGLYGWDPTRTGGVPQMVRCEGTFQLSTLLSMVLPLHAVYHILAILATFIAGAGFYHYLRRFWDLDAPVSMVGGVVFAVMADNLTWENPIVYVYSWAMPLIFIGCVDLVSARTRWRRCAAAAGILLASQNAFPVLTLPFFPPLHLILLWIHREKIGPGNHLLVWAIVWLAHAVLHAPLILGLLHFAPLSTRVPGTDPSMMFQALNVVRSLFPAVLFLPLSAWGLRSMVPSREVRIVMGVTLVLLVTTIFMESQTFLQIRMQAGILRAFTVNRFIYWLPMLFTTLMIIGLARIRTDGSVAIFRAGPLFLISLVLTSVGLKLLGLVPHMNLDPRRLIWIWLVAWSAVVVASRLPRIVRILALGVGLFSIASYYPTHPYSMSFAQGFAGSPLLPTEHDPLRPSRAAVVHCDNFWPSMLEHQGWETLDGWGHAHLKTFFELWSTMLGEFAPDVRGGNPQPFIRTDCSGEILPVTFDVELLAMANVEYLLSPRPLETADGALIPVGQHAGREGMRAHWLYRLRDTFPRAFLVHDWTLPSSPQETLRLLGAMESAQLRGRALLSGDPSTIRAPEPSRGTPAGPEEIARIEEYTPDRIRVQVTATTPGLLVITNNHHPGWRARVNEELHTLHRVNHTFQGVFVPRGTNKVTLEFDDGSVAWTLPCLLLGILLHAIPLIIFPGRPR